MLDRVIGSGREDAAWRRRVMRGLEKETYPGPEAVSVTGVGLGGGTEEPVAAGEPED